MPYSYEYPRPAVTVDMAVFTLRGDELAVLLIKRKNDPFKNKWALPGGFVEENEALERAAARELEEETGLSHARFEQLGAFGDPGRDPRGHTVSVAFLSFVVAERAVVHAGDDASDAVWHPISTLALPGAATTRVTARTAAAPASTRTGIAKKTAARKRAVAASRHGLVPLAFDHALILDRARTRLQERLADPTRRAPFQLLPPRFTLAEMQHVYQAVLGRPVATSFGRTLLARGVVEPVAEKTEGERSRARLYRFVAAKTAG